MFGAIQQQSLILRVVDRHADVLGIKHQGCILPPCLAAFLWAADAALDGLDDQGLSRAGTSVLDSR